MTNLPISGIFNITATYGQKGKHWANGHQGIDIICDNKTIYATCDGTVRVVAYDATGWGYYVSIGDNEGRKHLFCHLAKGSIKVSQGQKVNRSTVIGTMGSTGNSTGTHLHYQINDASGNAINPCPYLGVPNQKGTYNSKDFEINKLYADDAKIAKWAKDEVYNLKDKKIMVGDTNNNFNPTNNITRQEIAVAVYNAIKTCGLGYADNGTDAAYYDDFKIAKWAKDEVYFLRQKGLMVGGTDNKFRPTDKITRQEVAVLIYNVYGHFVSSQGVAPYTDDKKIAKWAKDEVYALKKLGLMVGSNNTFNPTKNITRQEVAVVISNLLNALGK
jgi:hypothetical protein